jgi:hypothetical protein
MVVSNPHQTPNPHPSPAIERPAVVHSPPLPFPDRQLIPKSDPTRETPAPARSDRPITPQPETDDRNEGHEFPTEPVKENHNKPHSLLPALTRQPNKRGNLKEKLKELEFGCCNIL